MTDGDGNSGFIPPTIEELNGWLSSYEFVELLACGGMGAVYLARQISLDRRVAIKILPPELAVNESFRGSFQAEGKAMAKVSHPNLVRVYDFGKISNMLYLVIEFVEGSNLFESMAVGAVDAEVAVTLIRSVATGLAEAHRIGLVHRDIKPANILINTEIEPKLGDFGLAVPDSDIESGLMMGTPAYLAPEVLADPSSASFSSDTYALGVILYEMLTGTSIERGDVMDLAKVPALGELPRIIQKAVDPQMPLRYQDAGSFEEALKDWLSKPTGAARIVTSASVAGKGPRMTPLATSNSRGGGLGMLVALFSLLAIGGFIWMKFGGSKDLTEVSEPEPAEVSSPSEEDGPAVVPEIDAGQILSDLRVEQKGELQELAARIASERSEVRRAFLEASGAEGELFLKSAPQDQNGIPRYFLKDEFAVSQKLLAVLQDNGVKPQRKLDVSLHQELSSLHQESVQRLRAEKIKIPDEVSQSWEGWVRWLGEDPLEVVGRSTSGRWSLASSAESLELHLSSSGKKFLMIGDKKLTKIGLTEGEKLGEFLLTCPDDHSFEFPWKLRWEDGQLTGTDSSGGLRQLRPEPFKYSHLLKSEASAELGDDRHGAGGITFKDPEVSALTENYRKALDKALGPLESGYLRVLEELSKKPSQSESDLISINEELKRVAKINWREGFVNSERIPKPEKLPSHVAEKQTIFSKEFLNRYNPLRQTYLQSLKKMKSESPDKLGDIARAIQILERPSGVVKARYVKLVSLGGDDITHTVIAVMEVLDENGKRIPSDQYSEVKVDSDSGRKKGEKALDGNPETHWHSKWVRERGDFFPNWISFSLGKEQLISGFSITPRPAKPGRRKGVANWEFYVSPDGKEWTSAAKGKFQIEPGRKEHLGF